MAPRGWSRPLTAVVKYMGCRVSYEGTQMRREEYVQMGSAQLGGEVRSADRATWPCAQPPSPALHPWGGYSVTVGHNVLIYKR